MSRDILFDFMCEHHFSADNIFPDRWEISNIWNISLKHIRHLCSLRYPDMAWLDSTQYTLDWVGPHSSSSLELYNENSTGSVRKNDVTTPKNEVANIVQKLYKYCANIL